jgi:hypothetical protein
LRVHLNLDRQTLAALRKDKPVIVASLQQYPKRKPLPEWPEKTIAVHRQRDFAVDSGVSLDWTNERTQRFVQEHLNALREVAASGE